MKVWPIILNRNSIKDVNEIYFFNCTDNQEESCALEIKDNNCHFIEEEPKQYTTKISVASNIWIQILSKELEISEAKANGSLLIEGNDSELKKFTEYFSGDPEGIQVKTDNYAITENEKEIADGKWTKPKRVLGLIGSPRRKGASGSLYSIFKQGLDECGCEIDTVFLPDLENKICKGCFNCWGGKDKNCVHKDDTFELIHKLPSYDMLVLVAPVYVDGLPGALKNFFDRMISLLDYKFILKDDHCRHPIRYPKMPHLVFLSTCGFAEMDNFNPMIEHVKEMCKNMHLTYLSDVLPPTGWLFSIPNLGPLFNGKINAIKEAAIEIYNKGKIPSELTNQISKQIFTRGQIFAIHNR